MVLGRLELLTEEVVVLLVNFLNNEDELDEVMHTATDMTIRVLRAKDDPGWWEMPGSPHFNKLMARIKEKLGGRYGYGVS